MFCRILHRKHHERYQRPNKTIYHTCTKCNHSWFSKAKPTDKYITIQITQQHIQNGKPYDEEHCPIALAMTEAGLEDAEVDGLTINYNGKSIPHDHESERFMRNYDYGFKVKPTQISLPI